MSLLKSLLDVYKRQFKYNGMPAEKFISAFLRSEYITPKKLVFKADNLYAMVMKDSSVKEVLIHD